jgi:hypothetical protein
MPFSKFIAIVLGILGSYYFIILLFDLMKSHSRSVQAINHTVHFEKNENPVFVADESTATSFKRNMENPGNFLPAEKEKQGSDIKMKSPMIDLGLETLSGDAYTVNAENLSKFIMS